MVTAGVLPARREETSSGRSAQRILPERRSDVGAGMTSQLRDKQDPATRADGHAPHVQGSTEVTDAGEPSPEARGGKADLVDAHFTHRGRGIEFDMEVAWVRRHLPPGTGPIVDIGCGIGGLFGTLALDRAVGVDLNESGLAGTRDRFKSVPLLCAGAERLPFADGVLDAITSQHVIEHIPEYESACREWYRVLKPGGMLLTLTPNARFSDPSVYDDETHVHIFSQADLPRLLCDAGFDITDLRTLGLPWFRDHARMPAGWRFRRFVVKHAHRLSNLEPLRWKGQTLCCAARKPA